MTTFLALTVAGLVTGCIYALTATGLVVTYTTTGVFNFAQGAMGMIAAFGFWQLWRGWGWPLWVALPMIVFVAAPLFGVLAERVLFRRMSGAPPDQSLAATLGLLLVLIGVANAVWPPSEARVLPRWAGEGSVSVGVLRLSASQLVVVGSAIVVAVALRLLFVRTRIGLAMRAVVDDPDLLAMYGLEPVRVQQLAWALGSSLAALAGVLLAPLVQLNILNLTLLVVNGYAAAMVGRLRNLPQTVLGALGLGIAISYSIGYLPGLGLSDFRGLLSTLQQGIPMLLLFVVLIVLPGDRLRTGTRQLLRAPTVPSLSRSVVGGTSFVVLAAGLAGSLSVTALETGAKGLVLSFILLSLVLLTGYSGQVSLCTLTFAGLGAYAMAKVGSPIGLLAGAGLAAAVGALVALPAIRLKGLYLALATFAFAQVMDIGFFGQRFGASGNLHVDKLPGLSGEQTPFIVMAALFALGGIGLLTVRRSRYGRRLTALDDSPAASATLGMRTARVKLAVFAGSAAIAGLGGAVYGGLGAGIVSSMDFTALQSAVLLLLLRVGGIKTVTGALVAGLATAVLPVIQQQVPSLGGLVYLVTGLAALSVGRLPHGLGGMVSDLGRRTTLPAVSWNRERKALVGAHH